MHSTDLEPGAVFPASLGVRSLDWQPAALTETEGVYRFYLPNLMQTQLQSNWCWAAVAVSVALYLKSGSLKWIQCHAVNDLLGLSDCCSTPNIPAACNVQYSLSDALFYTKSLKSWSSGKCPRASLVENIFGKNVPVCTRVLWSNGNGHFNAVTGFAYPKEIHGQKNSNMEELAIEIQDPLYGVTNIQYDAYPRLYQDGGIWTTTYLTQQNAN